MSYLLLTHHQRSCLLSFIHSTGTVLSWCSAEVGVVLTGCCVAWTQMCLNLLRTLDSRLYPHPCNRNIANTVQLRSVIYQIQAIYLSKFPLATSILTSYPLFGLYLLIQVTSRAPVTMSESRGNLLVSVGLNDGFLPEKSGPFRPPRHTPPSLYLDTQKLRTDI